MIQKIVYLLPLFFALSCASTPEHCTPLQGGYDLISSYQGQCLQLVYHGEEMSLECAPTLMVLEKQKQNHQAILFSTKTPEGIVSFNGTPHPKTNKMYTVKTNTIVRSERHPASAGGKAHVLNKKDEGICNVSLLPDENLRVICSATDKEGKMTVGEFKTTSKKTITCKEQFKEKH